MKKIFTTLLILTGICSVSYAQKKGDMAYGVSISINGSTASSGADNAAGTDMILRPSAAFHAEYYLSDQWSLKGEAIYDTKGWGGFYFDAAKNQTVSNVNHALNYITIPVLATWHIGAEKLWYANVGPYIGFLLSASNNYNNADEKSAYNSIDAGADVGLGIQFPLSYKTTKNKIFFEYNWQIGATNILANSANTGTLMRHSLGVGIRF
ncbi:MAG TPA: porin family protein [Mucilaginibacter sp.]|jgi:hypothetical protein|nr:porin family protein [Mucilaginibacter sp.]